MDIEQQNFFIQEQIEEDKRKNAIDTLNIANAVFHANMGSRMPPKGQPSLWINYYNEWRKTLIKDAEINIIQNKMEEKKSSFWTMLRNKKAGKKKGRLYF